MFMRYMYIYIYIWKVYAEVNLLLNIYYWKFITDLCKSPKYQVFFGNYYAIFNICFFMNYFKSMQKSLNKTL